MILNNWMCEKRLVIEFESIKIIKGNLSYVNLTSLFTETIFKIGYFYRRYKISLLAV